MFGRHTEYAIADNFTKYTAPFHLKNNGFDTASTEKPAAHLSKPCLQAYLYNLQIQTVH
ncbi:hypothetical protein EEF74_06385 [Neisseria gonorrhoeae]